MAKLENELKRLISAVDDRLPLLLSDRPEPPVEDKIRAFGIGVRGWTMHHTAAVTGLAALLVTAGWVGSSLYYTSHLRAMIEDKLRPYAMELAETVTTVQTDLAPNLAAADELKIAIDQARRDIIARDEEIEATIVTAQNQLIGIRDTAIDDIERRLTDQTDDLTSMLDMLRQRAADLDGGLNEVSQTLSAFNQQLPELTDGLDKIATQLTESRSIVDQVSKDAEKLKGTAPPLLASIANHQTDLEEGAKTMTILQAQLEALKGQTARSSRQLEQMLAQGRGQITSWQDMDRQVDNRKQEIMRNLNLYAESLNSHLREFIDVLSAESAVTGG